MSMEQAILELASGMKELAAAVRAGFGSDRMITGVQQVKVALAPLTGETLADTVEIAKEKITKQRAERDADQQAAGVCPEAAEEVNVKSTGKGAERIRAELTPAAVEPDAELEAERAAEKTHNGKPVTEVVNDKGVVEKRVEPDAELEAAVSKVEEDSKALDYKTDVRPVLLALAKKAGQPALKDLLTKYGAATGDKLTADQFAGIVADANALIAG